MKARTLRVFIAEDSRYVLHALKALIAGIGGIEVIGDTGDAATALERIREAKPDVAILDLRLSGGGSGIHVLRGLEEDAAARPVLIVFTSQDESKWRSVCKQLGADHFFSKGSDTELLAGVLRSMAARL